MMTDPVLSDMAKAIADQYEKLFGSAAVKQEWDSPPLPDVRDDERDSEPDGDDIVDRLRQDTPCIHCRSTCEEAALEIERLRLTEETFRVADGDILLRLNSAIFSMDPCGAPECVSPGVHFLAELREELRRLRNIEAKAVALAAAAKRVWRGESSSLLIHAAMSFEESRKCEK